MYAARWLIALGFASGCSFAAPTANDPADDSPADVTPTDDGPTDDGPMTPDAPLVADAGMDAVVDVDTDGDGLTDAHDNCPSKPNADQRNHDGDAFGDVCDPCPHVSGTADDTDGDGVGNACDPDPNAVDHLVVFEGFYDQASTAAHGTILGDGWSIDAASGAAVGDFRTGTGMGRIGWATTVKNAAITARFVPVAFGTTGPGDPLPAFGTTIGEADVGGGGQYYACLLAAVNNNDAAQNGLFAVADWPGTARIQQSTAYPHAITVSQGYEVNGRFVGTTNHCDVVHPGDASVETSTAASTTASERQGIATVNAQRVSVRVDYVFVVERAP